MTKRITTPLPVMVFFYGGSWTTGAASFPLYDGKYIIRDHKDVVIVTLNYRLGALGFMASEALARESKDGATGNYGLLDQRLALQWIQDNIAAFGGNPNKVLIYGESAGAGSVACHLVMPDSWGLFQRALMESGPFANWTSKSLEEVEEQYQTTAKNLGCTNKDAAEELACLRSKSSHDITYENGAEAKAGTPWGPVVDKVVIKEDPQVLAMKGEFTKVPTLLGTNLNEAAILLPHSINSSLTAAEYVSDVKAKYKQFGQDVLDLYPLSDFKSPWWAAVAVTTDEIMACPARRTANWLSTRGVDVFLYQFTVRIMFHLFFSSVMLTPFRCAARNGRD
eukprot:TRINITY_DN12678_c0_g1_i1.p1 TRINITY_DN12678_c0_g1~~TRINITY_DN12678_c0_g1_i1.p1  ORF type:complete len:361 (+),score=48.74 TRINITY_DN12678_c0_g1_i1:75-1085(+)